MRWSAGTRAPDEFVYGRDDRPGFPATTTPAGIDLVTTVPFSRRAPRPTRRSQPWSPASMTFMTSTSVPSTKGTSTKVPIAMPAALEFDQYRLYNADLAAFSDAALLAHYQQFGESEGRRANSIGSRDDFAALIPQSADALEIGPFYNPLLRGAQTKYFDVLARAQLVERAKSLGASPENVPEIHFVSQGGDFSVVDGTFEYILSSHSLEHQPDLIKHLQAISGRLRAGGRYFVLVPDKRYCFDHYIAESTLADVIEAYHKGSKVHSLKSVLEHRVLTTHNDPARHWVNDHGVYLEDYEARTRAALAEYASANGSYIDVHAWYFTPSSATRLLSDLQHLDYTDLQLERVYPTRRGSNEFWLILHK